MKNDAMKIELNKTTVIAASCVLALMTGCSQSDFLALGKQETAQQLPEPMLAPAPTTILRPARSIEARTLKRLLIELRRIDSLVIEASYHADPDARMRFDYELLRRDIRRISNGVEAHVRAEALIPPRLEPISGDYHR